MPIGVPTLLLHEADTANVDPETTVASITTVVGRYYEVVVECANITVSSVTMPGTCPMTQIHTGIRGTVTRVTAFGGVCTVGGTGAITVDFSGASTGSVIHCSEWTGVDKTTPWIVANVVTANGTDASAPTDVTVTLPNALTKASNCVRGAFACSFNTTFTPGTDFTELGDAGYNTPTKTMATEYDITPADLVIDGSFPSVAGLWVGIGWEINEAAASLPPYSPMATRYRL